MIYLQNKATDAEIVKPVLDSPSVFYSRESGKVTIFDETSLFIKFTVSGEENVIIKEILEDGSETNLTLSPGTTMITGLTNGFYSYGKRWICDGFDNNVGNITSVNVKYYDVSKLTSTERMFAGYGITSIDLSSLDMSNIIDTAIMFADCHSLETVILPKTLKDIGESMFRECENLTSITIPDSVTSIGGYAFYRCSGLTSVEIPSSVTSIGSCAFQECSSLTSAEIGSGVTSIGDYAFGYCSSLTSIIYNGTVSQWNSITKGVDWHIRVPSKTVVTCTDGTVALD